MPMQNTLTLPTITLNAKSVWLSPPYQPSLGADDELVGRHQECRLVLASWIAQPGFLPLSPLLVGEPGVGKNRLVYELARCVRKELYLFLVHEDITAEDLTCAVRFSDDPQKKMDYVLSPLATAMLRGAICLIDEIGKLRPEALTPLLGLLDERRYLDSTLLGERIVAHPGFRFIAATNWTDLSNNINHRDYLQSRLRPVIEIDIPSQQEINRILKKRFHQLGAGMDALLNPFWALWNEYRQETSPTPRDAIYLFGLTLNLAEAEVTEPAQMLALGKSTITVMPQPRHLEEAFHWLFPARQATHGC